MILYVQCMSSTDTYGTVRDVRCTCVDILNIQLIQ